MTPHLNFEMAGRFRVRIKKAGRYVHDTGYFENLITDGGLDRYGSGQPCWNTCRVGTGNTAPTTSDSNLASQIASTTTKTTSAGVDGTGGYGWRRNIWTFAEGAVVGNVAELGISWLTSSNGLFSRALVKDSMGNPTTVTVLADEQLEVTWELRFYWPTEDFTGTISNAGNKGGSYDWTARTASANSSTWQPGENGSTNNLFALAGSTGAQLFYGGTLGAITGVPTGTSAGSMSVSIGAYSNGTFMREITLSLSLSQGNSGTVKCAQVTASGSGFRFQFEIDPGITKTSDDTLAITFFVSWGRRS